MSELARERSLARHSLGAFAEATAVAKPWKGEGLRYMRSAVLLPEREEEQQD